MMRVQRDSYWPSEPASPSHGLRHNPASKWDEKSLLRLSVEMVPLTVEQFFGCRIDELPVPNFAYSQFNQILESAPPPFTDGVPPTFLLVKNLFDIMRHASRTTNANMLAARIMEYMGYQLITPDFHPSINFEHPVDFVMSGLTSTTHVDVALIDRARTLVCLFIGDKRDPFSETTEAPMKWPHPQVIAHALGAYEANLAARVESAMGHENLDMVIPAFTFVGTIPCFYIIPITAAFAKAVANGNEPPHPTKVFYCIAPVEWKLYGMMIREQRALIFRMFEAFKKFVPQSFSELYRFSTLADDDGNAPPNIPPPLNPNFKTNVWDWVRRFLWESRLHCQRVKLPQAADGCQWGNVNKAEWAPAAYKADWDYKSPSQEPVAPLPEPPVVPQGY